MSSFIKCLRNLFHQSNKPTETYIKPTATKYQFQPNDLERLRSVMHPEDLAKLEEQNHKKSNS